MGSTSSRCFNGPCYAGLQRMMGGNGAGRDVIVIVGPSGVGKSTLIKRLMEEYAGRFGFSVSHTTRQPRPGERNAVHYNFTTVESMRERIVDGAFIEHAEVHGNIYGTSFDAVESVVESGRICLLDIDVQGARQMKASSLDKVAGYIFIQPPSPAILEERLRGRGTETEEKIQLRLSNALKELAFAAEQPEFFHKVLTNADLGQAYTEFRTFMLQQCGRQRLYSEGADASPGWGLRSIFTPRAHWSPKN